MPEKSKTTRGIFKNSDIMAISIWKAGGADRFIDVEDAYAVCWELAPQRFSWRTRRDLPALDMLSAVLRGLTSRTDLLVRQGSHKVRLSSSGIEWVQTHEELIARVLGSNSEKITFSANHATRRLDRLRKSGLYKKWTTTSEVSTEKWELAAALRCSPDSPSNIWVQRLETLRADAKFTDDREMTDFIGALGKKHQEWFGGE